MIKLKCQECGQYYNEEDIEIIKNQDGSCFLNIYCPVCNRRSFAIALIKNEGQNNINKDALGKSSATQQKHFTTINESDVIDMCTFLEDFDGDFNSLFKQNH